MVFSNKLVLLSNIKERERERERRTVFFEARLIVDDKLDQLNN